ncbi:MAG TPA: RDD family protein [Mucilaginibacter sp.]|jgi:uncharacterized RDD family membrane protein YckC|nr:RDD family protein [Mucilaginibacter sp.]
MLNKPISAKSITVIAFVVSGLGLISYTNFLSSRILYFLFGAINPLNLSWLSSNNNGYLGAQALNILVYFLLLLGAALFALSKGREARLIRFVFAIILFDKGLFTVYAICHRLTSSGIQTDGYNESFLLFLFYLVARLLWIWVAYKGLTYCKVEKSLDIDTNVYGDVVSETYVSASLGKRFMNLLVDVMICILIFSPFILSLVSSNHFDNILMKLQAATNDKIALFVVVGVCRSLYYMFFELLLGATPGKLLTETRVIMHDGSHPSFKVISGRTVARFVPFEAFSAFDGARPWHDRWSGTAVVNEKREGV